ncbi:hypothetical protein FQN49_006624 [Arthroderma sp. PD_2]|nr:hypothetical protein FQN49_006624 [Arthroderma sp. PD_2]
MASTKIITAFIAFISLLAYPAFALDPSSTTNLVTYWGQGYDQERLAHFCEQSEHDIIVLGFINVFPDQGKGGWPGSDFGNQCDGTKYMTPEGKNTTLLKGCNSIIEDLPKCKAAGKTILLSLGGQGEGAGYSVDSRGSAERFADFLWGSFGPVSPDWDGPRPFRDNVVDGFDFDIEVNGGPYYEFMVKRLRSHFATDPSQRYYISAAPQCDVPDLQLQQAITNSVFDFIFVQFYNTPRCSAYSAAVDAKGTKFTFDAWIQFIRRSANPTAKVFIGLLGAPERFPENTGPYIENDQNYITIEQAEKLVTKYMNQYRANFGGVMLWDAATSEQNRINGRSYASNIKEMLIDSGPPRPTTTSSKPTMSSSIETTSKSKTIHPTGISSTFISKTSIWSSGGSMPTISPSPMFPNSTTTDMETRTTGSSIIITRSHTSSTHETTDVTTSMGTITSPTRVTTSMVTAPPSSTTGRTTYTTVIVTSYTSVCPTGITTVTTSYTTTYCPETGGVPTPAPTAPGIPGTGNPPSPPPPGMEWTTALTVCTKCAPTATTLTLVIPVKTPSSGPVPPSEPVPPPEPVIVGHTVTVIPTPVSSDQPAKPTTFSSVIAAPYPTKPHYPGSGSGAPGPSGTGSNTAINPSSTGPSLVYTGGASSPSFSIVSMILGAFAFYAMMV